MGRIITISSSKGGSAKSAWAMCLSANLAAQRYRVAVVDADPNQSFANWHKLYTGAPMTCTVEPRDSEIVDHAQEQAKNLVG